MIARCARYSWLLCYVAFVVTLLLAIQLVRFL
jgi:hypothetical protein